jgi:PilZ domain-containing protein
MQSQQTPADMSARTMVVSHLSWPISVRYHGRVSQSPGTQGPYSKERRYRRFDLNFPVSLSYPWAGMVREMETITKNVSVGGLLVTANDQVPLRTPVRLTMNVVGPRFQRPVRLSGEGEVVRVESLGPGAGFAIAVECKRPIEEIEDHLPA